MRAERGPGRGWGGAVRRARRAQRVGSVGSVGSRAAAGRSRAAAGPGRGRAGAAAGGGRRGPRGGGGGGRGGREICPASRRGAEAEVRGCARRPAQVEKGRLAAGAGATEQQAGAPIPGYDREEGHAAHRDIGCALSHHGHAGVRRLRSSGGPAELNGSAALTSLPRRPRQMDPCWPRNRLAVRHEPTDH